MSVGFQVFNFNLFNFTQYTADKRIDIQHVTYERNVFYTNAQRQQKIIKCISNKDLWRQGILMLCIILKLIS